MLTNIVRELCLLAGCAAIAATASLETPAAAAGSETKPEPAIVAVQNGTATFVANTNIVAVSVKGKSSALEAVVELHRGAEGLQLDRIEARLPVKTLATGMGLRDEHMRKYIFTTADGQIPDLRFKGDHAGCSGPERESTCQVEGILAIRGVARPFTITLKVRQDAAGFKALGDAVVKLSAYGIEQPSQFGVKTTDEVQLHFDFTARPSSGDTALLGRPK